MSSKLNALFSDSYVDISPYRDQHFKVSIVCPSKKIGHLLFRLSNYSYFLMYVLSKLNCLFNIHVSSINVFINV